MKKKLLIVEDNKSNIFLLKKILNDFDIICAEDGKEMWNALEKRIPDLILLDIIMPGQDGFQIANSLKQNEKFSDIPLIFVSAKNEGKDVEKGFILGGYDYIKKPFNKRELRARVESALYKKQLEIDLMHKSIKDPLTNCYNRRYYQDRIQQQINYYIRSEKNFSVALLDIDHFKNINDSFGHLAGDTILKKFSTAIKSNIRPYDILARYGGEEFTIIFIDCSKSEAERSLARIKKHVETSDYKFEGNNINMTFSAGIADADELEKKDEVTDEALIRTADDRMYKAKNSGRNQIIAE